MNKLIIPSSPNWYETDIMACAPDNTILYGSRQDIVVIKPTPEDQPDDVQIIAKAHSTKIVSVNINRNWGEPHKYAVTVSEDKIVKLWDVETLEKKLSHSKHISLDNPSKVIGALFAGDDRVVSTSENGTVVIWNLIKNETNILSSLLSNKVSVTCLSVCPHATWLAAFGLKSGLIVVADLRRTGKVLYTLRGHSKAVVSLSWCPAPINIFPIKPHNRVVEKRVETAEKGCPDIARTVKDCVERSDTKLSETDGAGDRVSTRKQKTPKRETPPGAKSFYFESPMKGLMLLKLVSPDGEDKGSKISDTETDATTPEKNVSEMMLREENQESPKQDPGQSPSPAKDKSSSEDSKYKSDGGGSFSSASSCDNELNCSKRRKETLNLEEPKKNGSASDSGEVFHDAQTESVQKDSKGEEVENWRTEEPVGVEEEPRKEFLLASSAKESHIYIWRAGTDGRMQTFITVPPSKSGKYQKKSSSTEKLWITLCWVAPNTLLSSSRNAELLRWTLPKPMMQAKFFRIVHKDHWSVLFSIKAPIVYLNEYNFLQKTDHNVWTTGMDRMIINTDLGTMRSLVCIPAFGGSINCLVGSPLDPNRLAIGTGEGIINIWDLSRPHKKSVAFSCFYQKIHSAVTALAWHPTVETSLAWGTTEGRIGLTEVTSKGKQPKIFPHFFKSQIFKLEWGPVNQDTDKQKLFVVSESKVAIFDPKSNEKEPEVLELPDNTLVYTMAWKPDYSMLLLSSKSGALITYSPDLKILNVSYVSKKLQTILWHPDAASDDATVSKYCKTFLSVIKHNEFIVFDLSIESENNEDRVIAHFENRGTKIHSIAWSPHSGNHLVAVDDGGVAQVYDIETKTVISTYLNRCLDPLLSVTWSPVNPDLIVVGTISHKIIIYLITECEPLTDKEIAALRTKIIKAQQREVSDQVVKEKQELVDQNGETTKVKIQNKSQVVPVFLSLREKSQVQDMQKLLQWKLENENTESNIGDSDSIDVLDVFGDQGNMDKVFRLNLTTFKQQGKHQKYNLLSLFQGDISKAIKEAIEQKRVNPWIISMCPMASPKLWQTACETYIQQLEDEPEADPLEIVTYLLACHKVEEAVKLLSERHLYREALVLCKARFGADSPMVIDILDQWAKSNVFQGNFELAACCYITLGKFEDAASVLFRRSNVELLEIAAQVAKLSGNEELHKAVTFRLNAFRLEEARLKDSEKPNEVLEEAMTEKPGKTEVGKQRNPDNSDSRGQNYVIKQTEKGDDCKDTLEDVEKDKESEEKPLLIVEEFNATGQTVEEFLRNYEKEKAEAIAAVKKSIEEESKNPEAEKSESLEDTSMKNEQIDANEEIIDVHPAVAMENIPEAMDLETWREEMLKRQKELEDEILNSFQTGPYAKYLLEELGSASERKLDIKGDPHQSHSQQDIPCEPSSSCETLAGSDPGEPRAAEVEFDKNLSRYQAACNAYQEGYILGKIRNIAMQQKNGSFVPIQRTEPQWEDIVNSGANRRVESEGSMEGTNKEGHGEMEEKSRRGIEIEPKKTKEEADTKTIQRIEPREDIVNNEVDRKVTTNMESGSDGTMGATSRETHGETEEENKRGSEMEREPKKTKEGETGAERKE